MQDKKRVMQNLISTAQYFERAMPDTVIEIYMTALKPFSDAAICDALNKSILTMKFFPKVAEIIEKIQGTIPSTKDCSAVAWSKLILAIERHGVWRSVVFQDAPIMAAVKAMGGWERVCEWQTPELNWRQKEFCELYSGLQHAEAPAYMPGTSERANIAAGQATEPPALADGSGRNVLPFKPKTDGEILKQIVEKAGI